MIDNSPERSSIHIFQVVKLWGPRLVLAAAVIFVFSQQFDGLKLFYNHARSVVNFRYPIDYGEGPLLDQVSRLAAFQNLYQTDITIPPYTITNYPPVYPWSRFLSIGFLVLSYGMGG
jgi:hypothetical protein